jgi:hypothetical protein
MALIRHRNRLVQNGVPAPANGDLVFGDPLLEDGLSNDGVVIPSQVPPEIPRVSTRGGQVRGKQRWGTDVRKIAEHLPNYDPNRGLIEREIVHPGGVPLTNFSGKTAGLVSGQLQLTQVFTRRPDRKRFILCNPQSNPNTIFFSFKNSPNGLIPLAVGQVWDESGSEISTDDIWICGQGAAGVSVPYVAYEGRLHGIYE